MRSSYFLFSSRFIFYYFVKFPPRERELDFKRDLYHQRAQYIQIWLIVRRIPLAKPKPQRSKGGDNNAAEYFAILHSSSWLPWLHFVDAETIAHVREISRFAGWHLGMAWLQAGQHLPAAESGAGFLHKPKAIYFLPLVSNLCAEILPSFAGLNVCNVCAKMQDDWQCSYICICIDSLRESLQRRTASGSIIRHC